MKIENNKSLKEHNAFKLDILTNKFVEIQSMDDFYDLIKHINENKDEKSIIIGDATNILFLNDFDGIVIKNLLKGIEIVGANYISPDIEIPEIEGRYGNLPVQANYISPDIEIPEIEGRYGNLPVRYIKVGSGEIWDDFVYFSVNKGLGGGIENLVKIPGKVGSGIVQNIGAYGVEIKDLLVSVEAYDFENNKIVNLKKEELEFEYRNSFFKKRNGKYFIISAIFKLENKPKSFILDYGNIKNNIDKHTELTPLIIANTISKIRESKLPDYKVLGNCGSFFKNPIINYNLFNLLKSKYKNIPSYKIDEDFVKIPAAWLIETSGFKGYQFGGAKVYENHSLIIVNENNATPKDIKTLSDLIINKVFDDFSIKLEPEVIFVN